MAYFLTVISLLLSFFLWQDAFTNCCLRSFGKLHQESKLRSPSFRTFMIHCRCQPHTHTYTLTATHPPHCTALPIAVSAACSCRLSLDCESGLKIDLLLSQEHAVCILFTGKEGLDLFIINFRSSNSLQRALYLEPFNQSKVWLLIRGEMYMEGGHQAYYISISFLLWKKCVTPSLGFLVILALFRR